MCRGFWEASISSLCGQRAGGKSPAQKREASLFPMVVGWVQFTLYETCRQPYPEGFQPVSECWGLTGRGLYKRNRSRPHVEPIMGPVPGHLCARNC
jgi:hypothetical protein